MHWTVHWVLWPPPPGNMFLQDTVVDNGNHSTLQGTRHPTHPKWLNNSRTSRSVWPVNHEFNFVLWSSIQLDYCSAKREGGKKSLIWRKSVWVFVGYSNLSIFLRVKESCPLILYQFFLQGIDFSLKGYCISTVCKILSYDWLLDRLTRGIYTCQKI